MLGRLLFFIVTVFIFVNTDQSEASTYITKKSDTSKIVEKIEKDYAVGKISKSECTKKKSKALKLGKVSKTICDNVEVKTAKKETKEEKKVEYIKKKEKKKKKAKKEFLKKTKDLSKKAKSWITKKIKKEKKHFKTIAQLPKSDFYLAATDGRGNTYIGYINGDESSEKIKIGTRKFNKIYNGKAFQDDKKTQCNVDSETSVIKDIYIRQVVVKCPKITFVGNILQSGNKGYGIAQSNTGIKLDFTFSKSRNDAIASLKNKKQESKEVKKIAKLEEKVLESKDTIYPVIKIDYNNETFKAQKLGKMTIEIGKGSYEIEGIVTDMGGSIEALRVDGRSCVLKYSCRIDSDGNFKITRKDKGRDEEIWLTAVDSGGHITDFKIIVKLLSTATKFINKENYYALLIGNQNYDTWSDLNTPIKDVTVIGDILEKKYKFVEVKILKDATYDEIEKAFWDLNKKLTDQDNLLIYYAGHGKKDIRLQRAFWIATNAENIEESGPYWYDTNNVTTHIARIKAKHVLLVSDSCFSGLAKRGSESITASSDFDMTNPAFINKMLQRIARVYISSGGDAPVYDGKGGQHSIFAKNFIKALDQNQGTISSQEIYYQVKKKVVGTASQNPEYHYMDDISHSDGEFIFTARN